MDRDNALTEQEFCVAMKLVLLRRKGYNLPSLLPLSLIESSASEPPSYCVIGVGIGRALFLERETYSASSRKHPAYAHVHI